MRRLLCWQLAVALLLAGMAAVAQVPNSNQSSQTEPPTLSPGVTVTGKKPNGERPLPKLAPDEFKKCNRQRMGLYNPASGEPSASDLSQMGTTSWVCERQLSEEMQFVLDSCLDRSGNTALPRIIQACTESMDHKLLESDQRFFLVGSRAGAYFASGDWQQALDDYNAAIKLAPHYGKLYYDRGVVFASRSNDDAALQDFDTAMGLDSKLVVPALLYRAKIYYA